MLHALDKKLLRDLLHLWPQALAIALVLACGVATFILAISAYRSLFETRGVYYDRYRFADVFVDMTRAPERLLDQVMQIDGVMLAEARIKKYSLLDIDTMAEPATGVALSLPDDRPAQLNRLYLRQGRTPTPGRTNEVVVNESFAQAHGFVPGDRFAAIMNGRKQTLLIVGIALSPEFIYALGPGDFMPDDRRFAVMWMSQKVLEGLFDLDSSINTISVKLSREASEDYVIERLDTLTEQYGGRGAYDREDQFSHAFIDSELKQLDAMSKVIPPIFLLVSAFLINMMLSRLIALEREQIGLLKAVGYGAGDVTWHYLKLVLAIAAVGIVIGVIAGTWMGQGLTALYGRFFHFPFLIYQQDMETYLLAIAITGLAAIAGGLKAVFGVYRLAPAVAMRPPAPARYRHLPGEKKGAWRNLSQTTLMSIRQVLRWPMRAFVTMLGVSLSVALLITALFMLDSMDHMIDVTFFQQDRQKATLSFGDEQPVGTDLQVARLPGVTMTEPFRSVAAKLTNGHLSRRVGLMGKPDHRVLSRVLNRNLQPIDLPADGLVISEHLANVLQVSRGDDVQVHILEGRRGTYAVKVVDISTAYMGMQAVMRRAALNRLLEEGPLITGVHVDYDPAQEDDLFKTVKTTPVLAAIGLQQKALQQFRATLAENINIMITVYVSLSMTIAFGVVYNSARIQLSERARELASLRVFGFRRSEVSHILLMQLVALVLLAQPVGWFLGINFSKLVLIAFESDLYTIPFVISRATMAEASLVVLAAAAVSALIVRSRVDHLDLVRVLKTRD